MFKKIKKLYTILDYYFKDSDNLLLYLMEMKAQECLRECYDLKIGNTEELEDLIFHIKTYLELPQTFIELKYPEFEGIDIRKMIKRYKKKKLSNAEMSLYGDYLLDIEKQRAVERDFIFEHAKVLSFGFEF